MIKQSVFIAALACVLTPAWANTAELSRADMGAAWPFTVERGTLQCHRNTFLTFTADARTYAINGSASAYARSAKLPWLDVRLIWRDNPQIPGTKVPLGAVIERGSALCK